MPKVHPDAIVALAVTFATPVAAQTPPLHSSDLQPLGSTLTADALGDLPSSAGNNSVGGGSVSLGQGHHAWAQSRASRQPFSRHASSTPGFA